MRVHTAGTPNDVGVELSDGAMGTGASVFKGKGECVRAQLTGFLF